MKDEQFDKFFRDAAAEQEAAPSPKTWAAIEVALVPKVPALIKRSWVKLTSAAAAVLLIGIGYMFYANQSSRPYERIVHSSRKAPSVQKSAIPHTHPSEYETPGSAPITQKRSAENQRPAIEPLPLETAARENKTSRTMTPVIQQKQVTIPAAAELAFAELAFDNQPTDAPKKINTYGVVEITPIQPLIESPEQEDILLAESKGEGNKIIPAILNKISDVINLDDNKIIRFSHDEEGSFQLDVSTSYVKSRFKKRR